jgi:hypothetical protein
MDPTNNTQKIKEETAFKAGEMRQLARDLPNPEMEPTIAPSATGGPSLSERLREGYEEAKESVMNVAHDLKEKVAPHNQQQPTTGTITRETTTTTSSSSSSSPYFASSSSITGQQQQQQQQPSITERLREGYEEAKETAMEKAHELREKMTPATTTTTATGEPRIGGYDASTTGAATTPDVRYASGITASTTEAGTQHTLGERLRERVLETTHSVKEKLENLAGVNEPSKPATTAAAYDATSANAPDYSYSSNPTSATTTTARPDYTQKASDTLHDTRNSAADTYHDVRNKAADQYHDVTNKMADKYHEVKNTASDYSQTAKNKMSEYTEAGKEKVEEWKHAAKTSEAANTTAATTGAQNQKFATSTSPSAAAVTTTTTTQTTKP